MPGPLSGPAAGDGSAGDGTEDPWALLRLLEGTWQGDIGGELGTGSALRDYEFILGGTFLMSRHVSVRLPQERSLQRDQHEEIGVFSFDRQQGRLYYRRFVIEGFVNRYACEAAKSRLVCTTEHVEGGTGMKARWMLDISSRYRFEETFELAWPGKELAALFTNSWTRRPSLE